MEKKKVNRRTALEIAIRVQKSLRPFGKIKIAGSLRRGAKRVGDVDLMGNNPDMVAEFLKLGTVLRGKPESKQANILIDGVQVDLWIIPDESWATGLMFTTGSMKENIWLRGIARRKAMMLNQYGLWREGVNLALNRSEQEVYHMIGVLYRRPPERMGWENG